MGEPNVYVIENLTDPPEKLAMSFLTAGSGSTPFVWITEEVEHGPDAKKRVLEPQPGFEVVVTHNEKARLYPDQTISYRSNMRMISPVSPNLSVIGTKQAYGTNAPTVWIPLPTLVEPSDDASAPQLVVLVEGSTKVDVTIHFRRLGSDYVPPIQRPPRTKVTFVSPPRLLLSPKNEASYEIELLSEVPDEIAIDIAYESADAVFRTNSIKVKKETPLKIRPVSYQDPNTGATKLKLEVVPAPPPSGLAYQLSVDKLGVQGATVRTSANGADLDVPYEIGPDQAYDVAFGTTDSRDTTRKRVTMQWTSFLSPLPTIEPSDTVIVKGNRTDGYKLEIQQEAENV